MRTARGGLASGRRLLGRSVRAMADRQASTGSAGSAPWAWSCRSTAAPPSPTPSGIKRVAERIVDDPQGRQRRGRGRLRDGRHHRRAARPRPAGHARCRRGRELDMLLTAGERISMALLAMAIDNLGLRGAVVHRLAGRRDHRLGARQGPDHRRHARAGSRTRWTRARSRSSPASRASRRTPRTSPRSAAAARTPPPSRWPPRCDADVCEIYTDVDGVFTADPRIVPNARQIDRITYEEMLELAACGAKVLHLRCVEYARRFDIPIHVRSSFIRPRRHLGHATADIEGGRSRWSRPIISGVAHDRSEAKITVVGVPDKPGEAARDLPRPSPTPRSTST